MRAAARIDAALGTVAGTGVRRRGILITGWLLAAVVFVPLARRLPDRLAGVARIDGSESAAVQALLQGPLASEYASYAVMVARGIPSPATEEGARALYRLLKPLAAAPEVVGVFSWLSFPDPAFIGAGDDGALVMVGLADSMAPPERSIPALRALTAGVAGELRADYPAVTLRWTGEPALNVDLRETSSRDVARAEGRALPLTALLLLFAFGAVAAALLPVVTGVLVVSISLGIAAAAAGVWPLSMLLQSVVTMLGLGLGIDYGLLMVSRFRDAVEAGSNTTAAAEEAALHAGHTILLSASTVALGFAALLLVPLNELRGVAVGGLLVVAVAALAATTLLPGVLAMLGPRVDWGRVMRRGARQKSRALWRAWGVRVTARPWLALACGTVPLVFLAAQAMRMHTGIPRGDWLPSQMESALALDDLEAMGRAGLVQAIRVVVTLPAGASAWEADSWAALHAYTGRLDADPRVARVRSLVGAADEAGFDHAAFMELPTELRARIMRGAASLDGSQVGFELIPVEYLAADDAAAFVRELRSTAAAGSGIAGATLMVGGLPAFNADYHDAVAGRFGRIVGLVVIGTMLALLAGFRSVLVPVKAIALNLLSVTAAFGAVTLVFQDGHGAWLLGVSEPVGSVFSSLPVVVFCIVFGLSMDYEIFLIARVREARRAGAGDRAAIVEALSRTGKVITNAAGVMLVVFAAFTLGDVLMTKMLGFALAVAVLLDATVVRMVVGPALLQLAGRWNWWPASTTTVRTWTPGGS
jgi:putative drug exporter of the RND superfamily